VNLVRFSQLSGVSYNTLLNEIRHIGDPKRANFLRDLGFKVEEGPHRKKSYVGREEDAISLGRIIKQSLRAGKSKGFVFLDELGAMLSPPRLCKAVAAGAPGGLDGKTVRNELAHYLHLWRENGQMQAEQVFVWQAGKVKDKRSGETIPTKKLRWRWAFHAGTAQQLWDVDCSVQAGAAKLRDLFSDGQRWMDEVKAAMRKAGFMGERYNASLRRAGVQYRPSRGGGPWLGEIPPRPALETRPQKDLRKKSRGGRPKGRIDQNVADRKQAMLRDWDAGKFSNNKAEAGRQHGFGRSDASKIINAHVLGGKAKAHTKKA
jgi:hypothetical protein